MENLEVEQNYQAFLSEKQQFADNLQKIRQDIQLFIKEFKLDLESTNILNFLDSNLECLIEDLSEWNKNDRDSWMIVISPDGICEEGKIFANSALDLISKTQEWDVKYSSYVDPIEKSLQRVLKYQDEQKDLKNESIIKNIKQNDFFNNIQSQNIDLDNIEEKKIDVKQLKLMQEFMIEKDLIRDQLLEITQDLCDHISTHENCISKLLLNQIKQLEIDLIYWTKIDRQSWELTLRSFKFDENKDANNFKQKLNQILSKTVTWETKYKDFLNLKRNDYEKFENQMQIFGMKISNIETKEQQNLSDLFANLDNQEKELMDAVNELIKLHDNQTEIQDNNE